MLSKCEDSEISALSIEAASLTREYCKESEKMKILFKFSIVINGMKYEYPELHRVQDNVREDEKSRFKISKKKFFCFSRNQIKFESKNEKENLFFTIMKDSISIFEEIIDNLKENDDLLNYIMFLSSDIKNDYQNKPVFCFDCNRNYQNFKNVLKNSLFDYCVFFYKETSK